MLLRGVVSASEVVYALILRETRTRFGTHQLGYLWALLEPLTMIATFYVLFRIGGRVPPFEMDMVGFVATGFVPYTVFASSVQQVSQAINGNKALLFYPRVHTLDLVFARASLELVTGLAVFIAIMGGAAVYRQRFEIDSVLLVLAGFALASLFGTVVGLLFCGLGQVSAVAERARGPLLRPLFWVSGIFFAAAALPNHIRDVMLYNPVLHVVELVRAGWYGGYTHEYAAPGYVLRWVLLVGMLALSLERVVRRRIEVT